MFDLMLDTSPTGRMLWATVGPYALWLWFHGRHREAHEVCRRALKR